MRKQLFWIFAVLLAFALLCRAWAGHAYHFKCEKPAKCFAAYNGAYCTYDDGETVRQNGSAATCKMVPCQPSCVLLEKRATLTDQ